ncbi:MAG TPA: peptidylprolyl isomerase [Candidatus Kapabacteria bacterium]|nr:peptidylprolyl isomerase [Candidatus Kapabacteria bacterium]
MRRILSTVLLVALGFALVSDANAQFRKAQEGDKIEAVVAIVGKHPIFKSSIDAQLQLFLLQRGITNAPKDSLMALRRRILQQEIDQKVLIAKADQDSIIVSEAMVDDRIEQQIRMYINQFGSEAAVEQQFGRTIGELRIAPELRERARESLIIEEVRRANVAMLQSVPREDVEEFFRIYRDSLPEVSGQVEIASIVMLVKPQGDQRERSLALATSLLDSIRRGSDFAELARRYSQDATATRGGDFGDYFPRGTFVAEFEEAAFKLQDGQVSEIVETDRGFHIIKMIGRRGEEVRLAQILIRPSATAQDEEIVKNELIRIREKAMQGEDFGKLAEQFSHDDESKAQGGYLGRVRTEELSPEQRSIIDSLQPGNVSMPLRIAYQNGPRGYQIVKLLRRVPPHRVSLEEDYRELEATAIQWRAAKDMQAFLDRARKSVYVEVRDLDRYYN